MAILGAAFTKRDAAAPDAEAPCGTATGCYRVAGLTKTYRTGSRLAPTTVHANTDIGLEIRRGEIFGLLGPNGAGKSTLVRQLTGLLRPDAGTIDLFGHDVVRSPAVAARLVAYLAQESAALDELTVALAIETTARLRALGTAQARAARAAVVDELGLGDLASRPLKDLSGGERRLACVAATLVGDRPVLVLDEPTVGMDPVSRRAVWSAIDRRRADRGTTVLLVTHNVIEAETVLDRVAVLDEGRVIACDTPGGLKAAAGDEVRLELVWRGDPPLDDPAVARLARDAVRVGRRWTTRTDPGTARELLAAVTSGPAFAVLDDFTLTTPSLEDAYLALGGRHEGLAK